MANSLWSKTLLSNLVTGASWITATPVAERSGELVEDRKRAGRPLSPSIQHLMSGIQAILRSDNQNTSGIYRRSRNKRKQG